VAFGIERLRQAVDTLTERVQKLGEHIHHGTPNAHVLTLDAVRDARGDLAARADSTRQDLANRIDAAHSNIDSLARELGAARRDIADLHALLQTWRAEAAEARTNTAPAPAPAVALAGEQPSPGTASEPPSAPAPSAALQQQGQADQDDQEKHQDLLRTAAGIAQAEFTCHRDLWAFFLRKAANEPHFHVPGEVRGDDGKVRATLSGPTLLATLTAMWDVRRQAREDGSSSGDWALSHELYEAVADAVGHVHGTPRHRDQRKVTIVIDRQPGQGDGAE
jgi:hypothetical protein